MQRRRQWQINLASVPPDRRSRDIFSYPIFSYFAGGVRRHISGHTRTYLNELQILRWDYFFRPNVRLINAVDKDRLTNLSTELTMLRYQIKVLQPAPALLQRLREARARDDLLTKCGMTCGGAAVLFLLLGLFSTWQFVFIAVVALVAAALCFGMRPRSEIPGLEEAVRNISSGLGYSVEGIVDLVRQQQDLLSRAAAIQDEINAILRFRDDIAAQRPRIVHSAKDMDVFLTDASKRLEAREKDKLNVHAEDETRKFGPIVRWSFETDRGQVLNSLKPRVNSIARRENHYARYEVQFLFVHRGRLAIYDGFYDLIQGEMMGEEWRHVVLGNIFTVREETTQDFDFRSHVQEAISDGQQSGEEMSSEGDDVYVDDNSAQHEDEGLNRVVITQTRTVQLIGNGPPVELKFMVVDARETWIAQLKQDRQRAEDEIATIKAAINQTSDDEEEESESIRLLNEHEERLLRIQEYEERVQRSEPARDVERIISQILEFAGQAAGRRQI